MALACSTSASSGQSGAIVAIMSRICCASGLKRGSARSSRWTTAALASVTATYVTLSFVMTTDLGRPRDPRIDDSVLRATVELLGKSGYADLSVDAIARRAGTSKPAIYRRWPSKAHLVHEAVFPISEATELPDTGSLAGDVREMVRRSTRRADHAGRAGGDAGAAGGDGHGPDAARQAAGPVRRRHLPRHDRRLEDARPAAARSGRTWPPPTWSRPSRA